MTTGRQRSILVLALLAMAWGGACSTQDAVARPEGFVDVFDTIGRSCGGAANTYECAKTVEQYRLAKGVPGVTRVGRRLSIAAKDGKVADFTDAKDPGAEDYVAYAYTEHLGCVGYHLLHRQFADSEDYLLVHAENGSRIDLPGVPVLAPDCGRLAVVSGLPYAESVLQIWRLNDTGRLTLEFGHQPDTAWTAGAPAWKDTTRLELPHATEDDPQTRRTLKVRLYTDGWRVEP
jgi:hypothetical protein